MDIAALRILLLAVLLLPVVVGVGVAFLGSYRCARRTALITALVHLALTAALIVPATNILSDPSQHPTGEERDHVFVPEIVPGATADDPHRTTWKIVEFSAPDKSQPRGAIQFFLGVDGLNLWLVALTSFLMIPAILCTWDTITVRANQFYAWLLVLQTAIIGVFLSFDIVLFYAFFELTLIPAFFLIGMWGVSSNRREAARKFFLYTLAGSLFTLVGVIGVVLVVYAKADVLTFSIPELVSILQDRYRLPAGEEQAYWTSAQYYLFLALALGFVVKVPLVPVHSWLPPAYSEAPTSVTMLLSGVLAKLGAFGLLRLVMPLAPDATFSVGLPLFGTLAAIGIIYAAFCAYAQTDLRRLVAYSSISHLGFCVLALLAFNEEGLTGGVLHLVNHGLATGALFLLVGLLMQRYGTAQMHEYSGLWNRLPALTFFMMVVVLANIGVPALNNFVSEMMMLAGLYELRASGLASLTFAVVAAFSIFMSAWYLLTMVQRVFFGPLREPTPIGTARAPITDLNRREWSALLPLTLLLVVLGCFPRLLTDVMKPDVEALAQLGDEARARAGSIFTVAD